MRDQRDKCQCRLLQAIHSHGLGKMRMHCALPAFVTLLALVAAAGGPFRPVLLCAIHLGHHAGSVCQDAAHDVRIPLLQPS